MRSVLVFNAAHSISNRFMLCRMLSASARKMHRDGVSTSQSINNSLIALHDAARASNGEVKDGVARDPAGEAKVVGEKDPGAVLL